MQCVFVGPPFCGTHRESCLIFYINIKHSMSANKKAKLNPTIFAKKLDRLLERTTDQNIQIIEYRSPNTLKILLNSGATFLDAPRTDPSKQTARKQLQWMQCQPVECLVEYKSKVHKGISMAGAMLRVNFIHLCNV